MFKTINPHVLYNRAGSQIIYIVLQGLYNYVKLILIIPLLFPETSGIICTNLWYPLGEISNLKVYIKKQR